MQRRLASLSLGVDDRVKTIYSPPLRSNPRCFSRQGLAHETAIRRQNASAPVGPGRVRAGCCGQAAGLERCQAGSVPGGQPSRAVSGRGPGVSGRGARLAAHPPSSASRGPDSERIRALFISDINRPRDGRIHGVETRRPIHSGCVHALRGHATACSWPGMCAVLGQATCSETPHPTGCSRMGTTEVDRHGPRGSTVKGTLVAFAPSGVEIGRNDWAAPEPVTGWMGRMDRFAGLCAAADPSPARRGGAAAR